MKSKKVKVLLAIVVIIGLGWSGLYVFNNVTPPLPSSSYVPPPSSEIVVAVAGVPKYLGETRDYNKIFKELGDNGFTAYMPFSQYVELPEAKSLDSDGDFFLPCDPEAPQWKAMRENNIKLIIPGYVIFHEYFEDMADGDPLQALIDCVGREHIYGVTNYDEPAGPLWDGSLAKRSLYEVYEKTKKVDPTLPVLMIHGSFYASNPVEGLDYLYPTQKERDKYFGLVKEASQFADIVGFDIYPVPFGFGSGITTPTLNGEHITDIKSTFADYTSWLKREVPNKQYLTTLQGFNYAMQYEEGFTPESITPEQMASLREPTRAELQEMVDGSIEGGATLLLWWGQTHITPESAGLWEDIKAVSKGVQN